MFDPEEKARLSGIGARMKAAARRRARERWGGDPWFECEPPDPPPEIQRKFDLVESLRLLALIAMTHDDTEVADALLDRATDMIGDANQEFDAWLNPDPF